MTRQDVNIAIDWAVEEEWNPGLHDVDCFYAADPNGFLVGLLDNEPVATISAVKYGKSFGFLGLYIVKPKYRGKGYGIQIWKAGLELLGNRIIGLDGVVGQQDNYRKSGFILAHNNVRYQGTGGEYYPFNSNIVPLSTLTFDDICIYDQPFFPDKRREFLRCWLNQSQSVALGVISNNKLAGYGVMRRCHNGYKIGPLFADSPEYAEHLFLSLRSHASEGSSVFLDIPAPNEAALDLVNRHNMTISFETARMYKDQNPNLPINRLFGVTTFELG